jgi:hypothetical protein
MLSAKVQIVLVVILVGGAFGVKALMATYKKHDELRKQNDIIKRYEWSKDFKSQFVDACKPSANDEGTKAILKQMPTLNPGAEIPLASAYSTSYCECLAELIEKERIIVMSFNPTKKTAASHAEEIRSTLGNFMISVKASQLIATCKERGMVAARAVR